MAGTQHRKPDRQSLHHAAQQRKATNDTSYFWDLVNRHMAGHYTGGRRMNRTQEEHMLFAKKAETATPGFIDDNIPVERSGPRSDEIPALDSFSSLQGMAPPSILRCIELLRYESPTPIQKHAIPLGLNGLDLMCCAQTVSTSIDWLHLRSFHFLLVCIGLRQDICLFSTCYYFAGSCIRLAEARYGQ